MAFFVTFYMFKNFKIVCLKELNIVSEFFFQYRVYKTHPYYCIYYYGIYECPVIILIVL